MLPRVTAVAELAVQGEGLTLTGFIPADWYPTGVAAAPSNLLATNGKGRVTRYLIRVACAVVL